MTQSMRVATVLLMDQDPAIEGKGLNIIHKYEDVIINHGEDPMMTLLKLTFDGSAKEKLELHNGKRKDIVNQTTLERTGKEVKLQPITIDKVVPVIQ